VKENPGFLTAQILTYLGNKRALLPFLEQGVRRVQKRLGHKKLSIFDAFSGSGIVARLFKQYAGHLLVNDLEPYSRVMNECYLANQSEIDVPALLEQHQSFVSEIASRPLREGIVARHYAPQDDERIQPGERVFYTRRNAMFIDTVRHAITALPVQRQPFFLAPLLAEASIHSNTAGVFKGFYKSKLTGIGKFGGTGADALKRIRGEIELPFPVFSNFECPVTLYNGDAGEVALCAPEVDLAYLDPPYNQHPYGSNYFMLNLILENRAPSNPSLVSGIPDDWKRSAFNKRGQALGALTRLVEGVRAKFVLLSFSSDGFIRPEALQAALGKLGKLTVCQTDYNTFRAARNLRGRAIHVQEFLYLLEKS
jgi:adenine-specific DNA-methyltransferase